MSKFFYNYTEGQIIRCTGTYESELVMLKAKIVQGLHSSLIKKDYRINISILSHIDKLDAKSV